MDHVALKKKLFFEIYVWGLYLEQTPGKGPKQFQLHFRRGIKREQRVAAFRQFLDINSALRTPEMRRNAELLVRSPRGAQGRHAAHHLYTGAGVDGAR